MLYRMFDLNIEVIPKYRLTESYLKTYESSFSGLADISVKITDDEIIKEEETDPGRTNEYHEIMCIFRHISEEICDHSGLFVHSAIIEKDGKGYMFTGPSGIGKSTHIAQWKKVFGDNVRIINGDKPIIRFLPEGIIGYSDPWNGKENYGEANIKTKLSSVCFLSQSKENKIRSLSKNEVFPLIMKQTVLPKRGDRRIKFYDMLDRFIRELDFYYFECNISDDAVLMAYDALINGNI